MKINLIKCCLLSILFILLTACGAGDGSGFGTDRGSGKNMATLSWTPPIAYDDAENTPLAESEIVGYRIYYGTDRTSLTNNFVIDTSEYTDSFTIYYDSYALDNNTVYYIAMTTITSSGVESKLSDILSFNSL